MRLYEVNGTYGSGKTPCTVFVAETETRGDIHTWYVCEGSVNVNLTPDEIEEGVNVEELSDIDMFTASKPIYSVEDLEEAINS